MSKSVQKTESGHVKTSGIPGLIYSTLRGVGKFCARPILSRICVHNGLQLRGASPRGAGEVRSIPLEASVVGAVGSSEDVPW